MPSRNRHRERMKGMQVNTDWEKMIANLGERARLMRGTDEERCVAVALDYLAGQMEPYQGKGWTVFNDWLDTAYAKHFHKRHGEHVPFVTVDTIRTTIFPQCKDPPVFRHYR